MLPAPACLAADVMVKARTGRRQHLADVQATHGERLMGMVTSAVPSALPPWRSVTNDRIAWQAIAVAIAVITSGEHLVLGMDTGPRKAWCLTD